ncbi:MAG TPA: SDR family NAD(P)-dependent oxidoreductase [Candidatus Alistipes intestinigallinarum]|uniref:SDR family NAD(P)-dependent oxidoreductase n=1 Tax=Candidatus Alistipes intestinigallinarum TaxID=2838440 RepID=A0A9D1Z1W9_9BACT|nr:SDR family NAD(P)-dependent oxidoreductase [Candidatus Alistipes intestinigallinarum]
MKRIVIAGATSGLGLETARLCIREGWRVGAAGRWLEALEALRAEAPDQVEIEPLDVTHEDAPERLNRLIERLGGMDIYLHSSGIGSRNTDLRPNIELETLRTNGEGFVRMIVAAFHYFRSHGGGHLAVISSIAGTKGLGAAPAYSATKRMQNTYIDALAQLARMEGYEIRFTDIRPGFVATPLLAKDGDYPMLMNTEKVARKIMQVLRKPRRRVVIDRRYAWLVFGWKLIPQGLWERLKIRKKE